MIYDTGLSIFGGTILPPKDNTYDLGSAARSWRNAYFDTAIYSTSVIGNWNIADGYWLSVGTDGDGKFLHRAATLNADTVLSGVLIGTVDGRALAANSLIFSNITADGDVAFYGNDGGNSQQFMYFDSSAAMLYFDESVTFDGGIDITGVENRLRDDVAWGFGSATGGDAHIVYESADADAKCLQFVIDESDDSGNNVPVFAFMEHTGAAADYGLFDAFVQPLVCVVDNDKDSWFGITFSADDVAQLQVGGVASSIGFNADIVIGTIAIDEDSGAVTIMDMSVSATPADGIEESISFAIDSNIMLKLYSEADSAGAVDTFSIQANYPLLFNTSNDASAVTDTVTLSGYEISAGHRALAIGCEEVVITEAAGASDRSLPVRINGTTYKFLLHT